MFFTAHMQLELVSNKEIKGVYKQFEVPVLKILLHNSVGNVYPPRDFFTKTSLLP